MGMGQTGAVGKYERKIRYLDYMENGNRVKGAGFVRLERWDGVCSFGIQITGLYRKDHFTRPFLLLAQGRETELCKLQFADGGVKTALEDLDIQNLDGQGLRYESVTGFRIPVSEGKEICCVWETANVMQETAKNVEERVQESLPEKAVERQEMETEQREEGPVAESTERREEGPVAESTERREEGPVAESTERREEGPVAESTEQAGEMQEDPEPLLQQEETKSEQQTPVPLMREDKWEQLTTVYPHVYPFHDDREYLSMGPGDFVIFPGRYYKLVSNSFLLHGFYNYDHLILARVEQRGTPKYYIGVPGNYFEREKKVAVLFGFVSFESDREPAEEGDFGYYMIPVEL